MGVRQPDLLVGESRTVDGLASRAILHRDVSSLHHEAGDHAVEHVALERQIFLTSTERSEVLHGLWYFRLEELKDYSAFIGLTYFDIEVHLRIIDIKLRQRLFNFGDGCFFLIIESL